MDNKLTNEEIARVFAMYLGCPVRWYKGVHIITDWGIGCFHEDGELEYKMTVGKNTFQLHERRLLLTPLASITDEDASEIKNLLRASYKFLYIEEYTTQGIANHLLGKKMYMYSNCFQFLVLKGYATPLFFSPGHWANNKTAIELGIAINKTIII